jgi:hypothetical protein
MGMVVLSAVAILALLGLAVIIGHLRDAPEGFEDQNGFHLFRNSEVRPLRADNAATSDHLSTV